MELDLDAIEADSRKAMPEQARCIRHVPVLVARIREQDAEIKWLRELCGEAEPLLFWASDALAASRCGEQGGKCDAMATRLRAAVKGEP